MQQHTLYAYVDGSDLDDVEALIEERLVALINEPDWVTARPTVVNQKRPVLDDGEEVLPDWELGLNLPLSELSTAPNAWFADVERIVEHLGRLHSESGRDFVIGIGNNVTGISEDLFFVESDAPDLARLQSILVIPRD